MMEEGGYQKKIRAKGIYFHRVYGKTWDKDLPGLYYIQPGDGSCGKLAANGKEKLHHIAHGGTAGKSFVLLFPADDRSL